MSRHRRYHREVAFSSTAWYVFLLEFVGVVAVVWLVCAVVAASAPSFFSPWHSVICHLVSSRGVGANGDLPLLARHYFTCRTRTSLPFSPHTVLQIECDNTHHPIQSLGAYIYTLVRGTALPMCFFAPSRCTLYAVRYIPCLLLLFTARSPVPPPVSVRLAFREQKKFCYVNSKSARKKLVAALFNVPRQALDLLPMYARLVAILDQVCGGEAGAENKKCQKKKKESPCVGPSVSDETRFGWGCSFLGHAGG